MFSNVRTTSPIYLDPMQSANFKAPFLWTYAFLEANSLYLRPERCFLTDVSLAVDEGESTSWSRGTRAAFWEMELFSSPR